MTTPQQILDQAREEFREILSKRESKMYGYYKSVFEDDFEGGYPIEYDEEILSWHTSTLQAFIGAEIARLEEMKKEIGEMPQQYDERSEAELDGKIQAIDDQITHLKELLLTLKR